MGPLAAKLAKEHNELYKRAQALKRLVPLVQAAELAQLALYRSTDEKTFRTEGQAFNWPDCPNCGFEILNVQKDEQMKCEFCGWNQGDKERAA